METRIQLIAVIAAVVLLAVVLELVRRRRLLERYALLWLLSAFIVLVLAIWGGALTELAKVLGIVSAPNALFFVALGFTLLLLLHFSVAVSRLTDQTKILAQRLAILEERTEHAGAPERAPERLRTVRGADSPPEEPT